MVRIQCIHAYDSIISLENLLEAWSEFLNGKRGRKDVQEFEVDLMSNIISLHNDLVAKTYRHAPYVPFTISDPKPRNIHKATVRDRLLHHAICRKLYPFFDRTFISDSYSCRVNKGTYRAMNRFRSFAFRVSQNHTRTAWVLKCDIRKFFASINHQALLNILYAYIPNKDTRWLLNQVICSFSSGMPGVGLPLGNLTSQLLVNVYMNELDQFIKHRLKARCYIRYADDFVILHHDKSWLEELLPRIVDFLMERLELSLHPKKVSICTIVSGVDFLGWTHFPDCRVLRSVSKQRMLRALKGKGVNDSTIQSYRGLMRHGNTRTLEMVYFDYRYDRSQF